MSFKLKDVVKTKSASGWFQIVEINEEGRYAHLQLLSYSNDETLYKGGIFKNVGLESLKKVTKEEALRHLEAKRENLASFEKMVQELF